MKAQDRDSYLSILKKASNRPLVICLLWTVGIGAAASCLIAKESSMTGKLEEVAVYLSFAVVFLLGGILVLWYQIKALNLKLEAVTALLAFEENSKVKEDTDEDEKEEEADD